MKWNSKIKAASRNGSLNRGDWFFLNKVPVISSCYRLISAHLLITLPLAILYHWLTAEVQKHLILLLCRQNNGVRIVELYRLISICFYLLNCYLLNYLSVKLLSIKLLNYLSMKLFVICSFTPLAVGCYLSRKSFLGSDGASFHTCLLVAC